MISLLNVWLIDGFGSNSGAKWGFVYRGLAFNIGLATPRIDPLAAGAFATQWIIVEEPERIKYRVDLDILPQDIQKPESNTCSSQPLAASVGKLALRTAAGHRLDSRQLNPASTAVSRSLTPSSCATTRFSLRST